MANKFLEQDQSEVGSEAVKSKFGKRIGKRPESVIRGLEEIQKEINGSIEDTLTENEKALKEAARKKAEKALEEKKKLAGKKTLTNNWQNQEEQTKGLVFFRYFKFLS